MTTPEPADGTGARRVWTTIYPLFMLLLLGTAWGLSLDRKSVV